MTDRNIQRVLVTGASGYVGTRLIPRLLDEGLTVRASFTDTAKAENYWWAADTQVVAMDVLDAEAVAAAVADMDAVVYLVHSMGGDDFAEKDRRAARIVADACAAAGVQRIVYVSGIVPPVDPDDLSEHITSRLEVEELLGSTGVSTVTLRAAVIMGSGSTSFEIIRQISERMPVHTVPDWMNSEVQPIAVIDLVEVLLAALQWEGGTRHFDVGGPDRLPYAALLDRYCEIAGLTRPQVEVPGLATGLVGVLAGAIADVPSSTVEALIESLHHDMVAAETSFSTELLPGGYALMGLDESIRRSLAEPDSAADDPASLDPMGPVPGDPAWAGGEGGGVASVWAGVKSVAKAVLPGS